LYRDLLNIKRLIDSGAPLTVEARLHVGQHVRIRSGALTGLEGMVIKRKLATRLVVLIKMLQQGVSLEIDDYLLDPID
jgi:transcription antitermination factor NusG